MELPHSSWPSTAHVLLWASGNEWYMERIKHGIYNLHPFIRFWCNVGVMSYSFFFIYFYRWLCSVHRVTNRSRLKIEVTSTVAKITKPVLPKSHIIATVRFIYNKTAPRKSLPSCIDLHGEKSRIYGCNRVWGDIVSSFMFMNLFYSFEPSRCCNVWFLVSHQQLQTSRRLITWKKYKYYIKRSNKLF